MPSPVPVAPPLTVIPPGPVASLPPPGWFYASNKKKHGPIPLARLREIAAGGQLQPSDMVLQEGTQKWVAARTLPGLFPGFPAAPTRPAESQPKPVPAPGKPANTVPAPASTGWYYAKDRKKVGPMACQELQRLASLGELLPTDMVLPEGNGKWVAASTVSRLFPAAMSAPPAPPALPFRPTHSSSPHACDHCKGTAFCGRFWDADGMMATGPVCDRCKEMSALGSDHDLAKVTCSFCQGKGFRSEGAESEAVAQPSAAVAWRLRALAASDRGDYVVAIAAYTEAIRLEPDFADAYYERGWALLAAGQEADGDADLAQAARLSPRYALSPAGDQTPRGPLQWLRSLLRRS